MFSWIRQKKYQMNCSHDFVKVATYKGYTYLCQHCMKKKHIDFSWNAEVFELKQLMIGHPVQSEFEYKRIQEKNKRLYKELEVAMNGR